ncbi:diguanylate cyclase [Bacillus marinisedimentorum]|uniref:diguanylate cyclase n=1 Tax=Bacillus marinisedimentorum TaxID=1821260 RepID=UPI0007E1D370|nr:diguanylate cyclase [Bacillus marinisedimentorum]
MNLASFKTKINFFNLYANSIIIGGILLLLLNIDYNIPTHSEWVRIYFFIGSILVLSHWTIRLPPSGAYFSMDSSIYLAALLLYGLSYSLYLLIFSSIIIAFINKGFTTKMHLMNLSVYSIAIVLAYKAFLLTGSSIGPFDNSMFYSYMVALAVYFLVNTALVMAYYSLLKSEPFFTFYLNVLKESLASYITTLLLSIILMILVHTHHIFGLFLYSSIGMLVAVTFKQHFKLFEEVSKKAIKDYLTGLYNHGYFEEELEKIFKNTKSSNKPLTLAMFDMDDFKKYNDTHGHYKGDQLLEFVAKKVKEEVTNEEWIVARYGGEEFAILMPDTLQDDALVFMNKLRKKINDTYFEGAEIFPFGCISFSVGVAEFQEGMHDKSQLIDQADEAMYLAKAKGKNQVLAFNEDTGQLIISDMEKEINELEQPLSFFLAKDVNTYKHSKRVFKYAVEFSSRLHLNPYEKQTLILGALIHDIGKIEIPRTILQKKGKLTSEEWEIVKKHVTWGKDLIEQHKHLKHLSPLVELHHERYDGKGYPYGLKGKDTPRLARILSVIDAFDAMTTERPYQATKSFEEAFTELRNCSGTQFDPVLVEPFIEMIKDSYLERQYNCTDTLKNA